MNRRVKRLNRNRRKSAAARIATGSGDSPDFFDSLENFNRTYEWIKAQMLKLRKQRRSKKTIQATNELRVRLVQLGGEFNRFMGS